MRVTGVLFAACSSSVVLVAHAQTRCDQFTFPPDDLTPTITGSCGRSGLQDDNGGKPEFLRGTSSDDIIDGSPPVGQRPPGCAGVHEKITGGGGDDIFKVDISTVTTGIDWREGEGDFRAWYPFVTDFDQGDTVVVYDSAGNGASVVEQEYIAELYKFGERNFLEGKSSGTIYVMTGKKNSSKVARMKYDCGPDATIWWRPCNSKSGYCTAQFCDRKNNRVYFPLICVPNKSPRNGGGAKRPYRGIGLLRTNFSREERWARYDGFYEEQCSCNKGRCGDGWEGATAGCCGDNPFCSTFPDSLNDGWSW